MLRVSLSLFREIWRRWGDGGYGLNDMFFDVLWTFFCVSFLGYDEWLGFLKARVWIGDLLSFFFFIGCLVWVERSRGVV